MDLNASQPDDLVQDPHGELDDIGPKAFGDPMGTPAADEKVLWRGRPELSLLARTAFHTRSVGFYFLLLIGLFESLAQPLAIVVTLPFAFCGAFWALWGLSRREPSLWTSQEASNSRASLPYPLRKASWS